MKKAPLGDLELEVLRFVAQRGPSSVREIADEYGESKGLARTTILTVMERLRSKGYLERSKGRAAQIYKAVEDQNDVMHGIVEEFVDKTLGGSLGPFVAYLAKSKGLTEEELKSLKAMVDEEEGK
jgi:predicted transcriptional regulator